MYLCEFLKICWFSSFRNKRKVYIFLHSFNTDSKNIKLNIVLFRKLVSFHEKWFSKFCFGITYGSSNSMYTPNYKFPALIVYKLQACDSVTD